MYEYVTMNKKNCVKWCRHNSYTYARINILLLNVNCLAKVKSITSMCVCTFIPQQKRSSIVCIAWKLGTI